MSSLVVKINASASFVTNLIGYTLRINYFLGETLFNILSWIFSQISTGTRTLLALIKIALFDFGQFVEDFGNTFSNLFNALDVVVNFCGQFAHNLFFAFLSALASFVSVVIGVFTSVYLTISGIVALIKHLLEVTGRSLVLLLQTLPTSLGKGLGSVADLILQTSSDVCAAIVGTCRATTDGVFAQYDNAKYIFKGIPGEAYWGLVLLIFIFLACHFAVISVYTHRSLIARKCATLLLRTIPMFISRQGSAIMQAVRGVRLEEMEVDSPSSSFDSTPPSSYNLRQRKPNQRATRSSRIESIKLQLQQEKEMRLCVICADRQRTVVLLPCRHFSFCDVCIIQVTHNKQYCPLCRQDIEEVVPVYQ